MGRTLSSDLNTILAAPKRKLDWTLDVTLPDASVHRYATSPLTIAGHVYANYLESVKEIRQSFGGPIDRVGIGLQNKDGVIGLAIAENAQNWQLSDVLVGRYYQLPDGSVSAWIPMFTGTFEKPEIVDLQVTTDIVSDVASAGLIVCTRSEALACSFRYKDPATCAYTGLLPTCNHLLKSSGGCDGHNNSEHFGGFEHRYKQTTNVPGTGGNDGSGGPRDGCPRIDQWIPIEGENGGIALKRAGDLEPGVDRAYDTYTGLFETVDEAEILENVAIWEVLTDGGARGFSSFSHPIFPHSGHLGLAVSLTNVGETTGVWSPGPGRGTDYLTISRNTGRRGDVVRIHLASGHRYAYGSGRTKFIECHNRKIEPFEL